MGIVVVEYPKAVSPQPKRRPDVFESHPLPWSVGEVTTDSRTSHVDIWDAAGRKVGQFHRASFERSGTELVDAILDAVNKGGK
jgi:hypothetical protein